MMMDAQSRLESYLTQLAAEGVDLSKPRSVEFYLILPNEKRGNDFAESAKKLGLANVDTYFDDLTEEWNVVCQKTMIAEATEFLMLEMQLNILVSEHDGRLDELYIEKDNGD